MEREGESASRRRWKNLPLFPLLLLLLLLLLPRLRNLLRSRRPPRRRRPSARLSSTEGASLDRRCTWDTRWPRPGAPPCSGNPMRCFTSAAAAFLRRRRRRLLQV